MSLIYFLTLSSKKGNISETMPQPGGALKLPRREQIKHGIRQEQPGSMTSTGWKVKKNSRKNV